MSDSNETANRKTRQRREPKLTRMAEIEARPTSWLWPGRIAEGRITLICGMAGLGKSFLTCDVAARVSIGANWPDDSQSSSGSVIFASTEDDPHDTIRPRLDAHGADVTRIHLLEGITLTKGDQVGETAFTLQDVAMLESSLKRVGDCKLVVIDPIGSYLGSGINSHKDDEVRSVLTPVSKLAERYRVAVLIVAHRRKSSANYADDTVLGSRAFTAVARTVFHLSPDSEKRERRLLLPGKNNLAAVASGLAFTISGNPAHIVWESDAIELTADDALAMEEDEGDLSARDEAVRWLKFALASGPRPGKEIQEKAEADGIKNRTLRRASEKLGVIKGPSGFGGKWEWRLSETPDKPESARDGQEVAD